MKGLLYTYSKFRDLLETPITVMETAENGEEQETVYYRDWWDDFSEGL